MKPDIELHIEELVLHGFEGYSAPEIREALAREIGRQLQKGGLSTEIAAGATVNYLRTGNISIKEGAGAEAIGGSIARSLVQPLQNGESGSEKSRV